MSERERRAFLLFAAMVVCSGLIMGVVSVHLLTLLQARGVALATAVSYGALIGPSQVGARLIEMAGKGLHHPLWTLTAALVLTASGLILLAADVGTGALVIVLYGAGNGILSIARGTVPLSLFGPTRYAPLVGRLARPGLVAQALAPPLGAFAIERGGAGNTLGLLVVLALINLGVLGVLWAGRPDRTASSLV